MVRAFDLLPLGHLGAPWSFGLANSVEALMVRLRSALWMLLFPPILTLSRESSSRTGRRGQFGGLRRVPKRERDGGAPCSSRDVPPSSSFLDRGPSLCSPSPIEVYTYSTSHAPTGYGLGVTATSQLVHPRGLSTPCTLPP